ncbi:ubiquitin-activating enzyme E1 C [Schistosoma japonicum]|nr:ubiquitin-activating enzyme E1 C [Schistosoma japonicum]
MYHLQRESYYYAAPKPHARRKTPVSIDDREIPLRDLCNDFIDFGSLQLPDLFSSNIREPYLDFMDTQTYQARVEDITLVEDPSSAITDTCFSFGEDLLPNNLELISGSIADNPYDAQSVCVAPGTIQRKKRRVSEHLVLENESGAVKHPSIKLSCDSNESQISTLHANLEKISDVSEHVADFTVSRRAPEFLEPKNISKDSGNLKMFVHDNTDTITILQSSNIPMKSLNTISSDVDSVQPPTEQFNTETINNSHQLENVKQLDVVVEQFELATDFVTGTDVTQIIPQDEEKIFNRTLEQNLPPISSFHLSPLHTVESNDNTHSRRIRKRANKLIIDEITRLTGSELRWNLSHGEETMISRDAIRAEPGARSRTQYLLSRSVPRLFAVPSNLETALSLKLCELWCYHRRLCEKTIQKRKLEVDMSVNSDATQTKRPADSSSIKMSAITEENETSVEIQRYAGDHSSLVGSGSLFGASNLIDVTNNQTNSVRESLVQMKESLKNTIDQPLLDITSNLRINAVSASTPQGSSVPISGTSRSLPVESTTLVPVLEEFEEHVQQQNEFDLKTVVCDVTEIFHQPCPPTEVASSSIRYFGDKSQLWRYLEDRLTQSTVNSIDIEELCPFGCNKKEAAFVFITLLEFAKKRRIILSQTIPYGSIVIRIRN